MTLPLVLPLPGNEAFALLLATRLTADVGTLETRAFPDGESYVRLLDDVSGRDVIVVCTLNDPDRKFLRLIYVCETARELGASSVGLVVPYLAYMRQDTRFQSGEAVTSRHFARIVSATVDWLVTVDPHLHRLRSLDAIYRKPARAVHAGPALAEWITKNVPKPVLIGPDVESEQWVSAVAGIVGAPYRVLSKVRSGDRSVEISVPDLTGFQDLRPVLLDDIFSSGRTMIEAARRLREAGAMAPVCIAVHGLGAPEQTLDLLAYADRFVTSNTIENKNAVVDVSSLVAEAVQGILVSRASSQSADPE
jgi:ribose-phosphate pyrophosphokinase